MSNQFNVGDIITCGFGPNTVKEVNHRPAWSYYVVEAANGNHIVEFADQTFWQLVKPITLNELVLVARVSLADSSFTIALPDGTLATAQHGQYDDLFIVQPASDLSDLLIWHLYGESPKAQVVAALQVLLNEGETWEPWHVTTAIEGAA